MQPEQSHLGKLLTTRRQLITNLTIDGAPCGKECGVDGRASTTDMCIDVCLDMCIDVCLEMSNARVDVAL